MSLRLAIDLDKTLCFLKKPNEEYIDVLPLPNAVETMKAFKERGYYLIVFTARGMATCDGKIGLINKVRVPVMVEWLNKHEIPFDEIVIGKPHCDFFIDDKNIEFKNNWPEIRERLLKEEKNVP